MDLRALSIFIEVAELGSFTRAGEKLGYSQPTISFQIKQLCEQINIPYLAVETDYSTGDSGQLATRLEAFLEML